MQKIKKLSTHEAQKIAAGEVVERPANVLKELLENAIDAQATKITIYVEDGGKSYIRIVDDGYGMSPEDAVLCFEQHATSKITSVDELTNIATFGFRGEALASIAAVSKITLITKEAAAQQGTKIIIEANEIITDEIIHANTGTDITVKDLFFNLPARKKFLKTRETEWHQIQQLFFAFCLSHLHINFKLYSENKLLYTCPKATNIQERCAQLFEQKISSHMLPVEHINKTIGITGLISHHQYERYDRTMIYLFVNQRWVKDTQLVHAFIKGYKQVLPPGRYPAGCLHITVDPTQVDINIHPRKEEVQFLHPRNVLQSITSTVTHTLEKHLSKQLEKTVQFKSSSAQDLYFTSPRAPQPFQPFDFDTFFIQKPSPFQTSVTAPQTTLTQYHNDSVQPMLQLEQQAALDEAHQSYNCIGQFKNTYIILEHTDGLLLIDQHAAHERILYEQFCQQHGNTATVKLMFPHIMHVSAQDFKTVTDHAALCAQYGIEIEPFGNNTLKVQAMPIQLKHAAIDDIIKDAIAYINECKDLEQQAFTEQLQKKLYADMSCKAAVKAGDTLTQELMQELIKNLYKSNNRFSCPHGRPTHYLLHIDEIEKKFKRDYRTY